jgi:hypothetical protein
MQRRTDREKSCQQVQRTRFGFRARCWNPTWVVCNRPSHQELCTASQELTRRARSSPRFLSNTLGKRMRLRRSSCPFEQLKAHFRVAIAEASCTRRLRLKHVALARRGHSVEVGSCLVDSAAVGKHRTSHRGDGLPCHSAQSRCAVRKIWRGRTEGEQSAQQAWTPCWSSFSNLPSQSNLVCLIGSPLPIPATSQASR